MLGLTPAVLLLLMLFSLLDISHFSLPSCGLLEDLLESRFDFECFTSYGFSVVVLGITLHGLSKSDVVSNLPV